MMKPKTKPKVSVKTARALERLQLTSVFSLATAKKAGLSQPSISRLIRKGVLSRMGPGLYQVSDSEFDPRTLDYVIAAKLFGDRVAIGGLTALFHYGLIDDVPQQLWLLVPPSVRNSGNFYRIIRTSRNLRVGVTKQDGYRIVSIERAIVDAFIFGTKVGKTRGLACAIRALREKKTTEKKIFEIADRMGALEKISRNWDAVALALE